MSNDRETDRSGDGALEKINILRLKAGHPVEEEDRVAEEIPLTIILNDEKELLTFLCSPDDLEDLVRGFLFTSGIITETSGITRIIIDRKNWTANVNLAGTGPDRDAVFRRLYTSGCGRGALVYNEMDILKNRKPKADVEVETSVIFKLMRELTERSELYLKTGGAHSAALADREKILILMEDIGRHNAVDKVVGRSLEEEVPMDDKILITSGRVSSEVLFKAGKCGFPVIVSKGAPTDQAVKLAVNMNITLAGFVRGRSMNIYSAPERIRVRERQIISGLTIEKK